MSLVNSSYYTEWHLMFKIWLCHQTEANVYDKWFTSLASLILSINWGDKMSKDINNIKGVEKP